MKVNLLAFRRCMGAFGTLKRQLALSGIWLSGKYASSTRGPMHMQARCHRFYKLNCLCPVAPVVVLAAQPGHWFVIDCEHARRINDPLPQLNVRCAWAKKCSASTDLYMVGRLLQDLGRRFSLDDQLQTLQHLLLSKTDCFDVKLSAKRILETTQWLREASPAGSPQGASMCWVHQKASMKHAGGIQSVHMHLAQAWGRRCPADVLAFAYFIADRCCQGGAQKVQEAGSAFSPGRKTTATDHGLRLR